VARSRDVPHLRILGDAMAPSSPARYLIKNGCMYVRSLETPFLDIAGLKGGRMALPAWTDAGLLPPGAHAATMPDIYDRFVSDAPEHEERDILFNALTLHLQLIRRLIPAGRAWIDGSFCTRQALPPNDVDVVIHPADRVALEALELPDRARLYMLLTLKDVAIYEPALVFPKLQAVSGLVDAYICAPGHEDVWDANWSRVTDAYGSVIEGKTKGYAEVAW